MESRSPASVSREGSVRPDGTATGKAINGHHIGRVVLLLGSSVSSALSGAAFAMIELVPPPVFDVSRFESRAPRVEPKDAPVAAINRASRGVVLQRYFRDFLAYDAVPQGWMGGNVAACLEGSNSAAHNDAVTRRINYYRAMAGLPGSVVLNATLNAKDQKAALVYSYNRQLSHQPDSSWGCWSQDAYDAGSHSNIALGLAGTDAIDAYIDDSGGNNTAVGHRRWILYPPQTMMGTGSIPSQSGSPASNALWVLETASWVSPGSSPEWVAWPPAGYVPYTIMPIQSGRWSFSLRSADFSAATVMVTQGATALLTTKEPLANGYGDNTLVWRVSGANLGSPPPRDTTYRVTISNVNPGARTFSYDVTVIDTKPPMKGVWRPDTAQWLLELTMDQTPDESVHFGSAGGSDRPLLADVTGDGSADLIVFRGGQWFVSSTRASRADVIFAFGGAPGDVPLAGDFDRDGKADLVVYRSGYWYVSTQRNGVADRIYAFGGVAGDVPLAADFDGDGIADLAIYRNGVWFIDMNRDGVPEHRVGFGGVPGDQPMAFDWDGDGRADLAIFRDGTWYVSTARDGNAQRMFRFGNAGDVPLGAFLR